MAGRSAVSRRTIALSGTFASARHTSGASFSLKAEPIRSSTSASRKRLAEAGCALGQRRRAGSCLPRNPRRIRRPAGRAWRRDSPETAAARATARRSGCSNCLSSRLAAGRAERSAAAPPPFGTGEEAFAYDQRLGHFRSVLRPPVRGAAPATISSNDTPNRWLNSSTTTISPRATTFPLTTISTGSPTR